MFQLGQRLHLIGEDKWINLFLSMKLLAKLDTINYEVPCMIANRVPRLYKKGEKIVNLKNYLLED